MALQCRAPAVAGDDFCITHDDAYLFAFRPAGHVGVFRARERSPLALLSSLPSARVANLR
jgi:hypothetical protein